MKSRLVLVDDHDVVRQGLAAVLARFEDLAIVGEARHANDAYRVVDDTNPEVVVLDLALPGTDGIAVTRELLRRSPKSRILIFSMHAERDMVLQAFSAGARGYAVKTQAVPDVVEAVRAVARGERYFSPQFPQDLREALASDVEGIEADDWLDVLSPREREIFDLVLRAFSSVRIARELFISVKTVETHRANIHRKLHAHSTVELVRLAALRGRLVR